MIITPDTLKPFGSILCDPSPRPMPPFIQYVPRVHPTHYLLPFNVILAALRLELVYQVASVLALSQHLYVKHSNCDYLHGSQSRSAVRGWPLGL